MKRYRNIKLYDEESQDLDVYMQEILDRRKQEEVESIEAGDIMREYAIEETGD
jgi:DNA-directed RNA polymerase subunit beta'